MLKSFPVVGGSYRERATIIDVQRTINWYVNMDKQGKRPSQLISVPGIQTRPILQLDTGNLPVRAQFTNEQFQYIVAGDTVYRMDTAEVSTVIGTLTTTSTYVSIACNGTQVMFTDLEFGYIYDIATTVFTQIPPTNFPVRPLQVVYQSNRFAVCDALTNVWFISALGNGLVWNASNFALKNAQGDLFAGIGDIHNRILLFGSRSIEFWEDEGDATFPFRRDNNILPQYGCAATATIAQGGVGDAQTALFFLSGDTNGVGSVMMTTGGNPSVISNEALDAEMQTYARVDDAVGYVYKEDGHYFYMLFFPTPNRCWCYDATIGDPQIAWHEREMLDMTRFIGQTHAFFNGKHYVGDYRKPTLYEMSKNFYRFDTETIRCTRVFQYLTDGILQRQIREIQIDMLHGVGNNEDPGKEPFAYLAVSKNDGNTFGSLRRAIVGRMGRRRVRTRWLQWGTGRSWVFKLIVYAPVPKIVVGGAIDMQELSN